MDGLQLASDLQLLTADAEDRLLPGTDAGDPSAVSKILRPESAAVLREWWPEQTTKEEPIVVVEAFTSDGTLLAGR